MQATRPFPQGNLFKNEKRSKQKKSQSQEVNGFFFSFFTKFDQMSRAGSRGRRLAYVKPQCEALSNKYEPVELEG